MKKLFALTGLAAAVAMSVFAAAPGAFAAQARSNPYDVRDFVQRNATHNTIVAEYVSPSDVDDWYGNWLINGTIAPGESSTLYFPVDYSYSSACIFDIQIVMDTGQTITNWGVNLCDGNVVLTARSN